jgi:hypothetical protein
MYFYNKNHVCSITAKSHTKYHKRSKQQKSQVLQQNPSPHLQKIVSQKYNITKIIAMFYRSNVIKNKKRLNNIFIGALICKKMSSDSNKNLKLLQ